MRGETLFYQGNLEEAEVLAYNALLSTEIKKEDGIFLGAVMLQARISILTGDEYMFQETQVHLKTYIQEKRGQANQIITGLIQGFLVAELQQPEKAAIWLRKVEYMRECCI